jgi:hypothetical protein
MKGLWNSGIFQVLHWRHGWLEYAAILAFSWVFQHFLVPRRYSYWIIASYPSE